MHVIRIGHTTYALHIDSKTMFMVFKHKNHAHTTEAAIRRFVRTHKTLPPTGGGPLISLNNPENWVHLLYELKTDDISSYELHNMCELCDAGYLYVEDMKIPEPNDYTFKLSYNGNIYDGIEMSMDDKIRYLETLL